METHKNSYNNNIFKFEYILKKQGQNTDKSSIKIYVNKIENRITFKIKTGSEPSTLK